MQYKELKPETLDLVCSELDIRTRAGKVAIKIKLENAQLLDRKQQDYGPRNISGFGLFGVIVRMNDKFERMKNMITQRRKRMVNESFRDSLRDVENYSTIGTMIDKGVWPNE